MSLFSFAKPLVINTSTKHHTNELKRAAIKLRKASVSLSIIKAQLKLPEGDIQALDPILESGSFHAQEAGGGHLERGRDQQHTKMYTALCKTMQINSFSSKFVHLLSQK
jgi:hypothetical protein